MQKDRLLEASALTIAVEGRYSFGVKPRYIVPGPIVGISQKRNWSWLTMQTEHTCSLTDFSGPKTISDLFINARHQGNDVGSLVVMVASQMNRRANTTLKIPIEFHIKWFELKSHTSFGALSSMISQAAIIDSGWTVL